MKKHIVLHRLDLCSNLIYECVNSQSHLWFEIDFAGKVLPTTKKYKQIGGCCFVVPIFNKNIDGQNQRNKQIYQIHLSIY